MQESTSKALPTIRDITDFGEWGREFKRHKDYLLIHELRANTMAPFCPAGSIIIADTRERWPMDGELYLVQFDFGKTRQKWAPQVAEIFWHHDLRSTSLKVMDSRIPPRETPFIMPIEPEELESRKIRWILGRVWGVLKRFE